MKSLEMTLRQRNILYMMENAVSYVTSRELAEALKVSSRTIRNDIVEMNRILAPYGASIESTQSKGFLFCARDPAMIRELSRIDTAFFSRDERIRYLAFRLCSSEAPVNLYDLEDEVFVSRTALISDIRALRHRYSYAQPFIRLIQNHDEVSFEQDELKIRSLLLILFHEDWDYNSGGNAFYGFHILDSDLLGLLMENTSRILARLGIRMDDPTLIALELTIAIMHYRYSSGHPYPDTLPSPDAGSPSGIAVRNLFDLIEKQTGISYPLSEKARIDEFIRTAHLSPFIPTSQDIPHSGGATPGLQNEVFSFLGKISQTFGLDFTKDEEFIGVLGMFLSELHAGNSIFARHRDLSVVKGFLTAEYELAYLYQDPAPEFLDRYLTEQELCNMALCFSGAIRHYLAMHPEKKLKAVLFSHRNMAAAWALKRQILESLQLYLEITDVLPVNFKDNFNFAGTDLVLSTVRKKITDPAVAETVIVDDLPSYGMENYIAQIKQMSFKNLLSSPPFSLEDLLSDAFWHEDEIFDTPVDIIDRMSSDFISAGIAGEQHRMSVSQRETHASFAIKSGLVFLHTILPAKETKLSVMTLRQRMRWNEYKISTVIMAMFRKEDRNLLFHLKQIFCSKSYDRDLLQKSTGRKALTQLLLS